MNTLVVITGPTGVGKTDTAISIAQALSAEIISADSRQLYRDIPIGTAAPTAQQQAIVPHHFVGTLALDEYYSAAQFESDVMQLLPTLFKRSPYAVMCGGSMLYIDAVCKGIDDIPTVSDEIRAQVYAQYEQHGLDYMLAQLQELDPEHYSVVDKKNYKRVVHAVEICLQAGQPYSSLRTNSTKERPFRIIKIGLNLPREQLFDRINRRVVAMVEAGLIEEARKVYPLRQLNSLNTVGFKELFAYFDGTMDYDTAVARIQKNTRVYAKKQLTWYAKDDDMRWFAPSDESIMEYILQSCK
ncbi:MAG: tRNA (adenosine(37)-N6)-dimethylallyltransferase MiaA [Bacteroidaceae bacterium]|nr:tRNA (adenosine(37)-N6)-dimethylallyltransferase MiaA [Bacteroidaceae bacterium]